MCTGLVSIRTLIVFIYIYRNEQLFFVFKPEKSIENQVISIFGYHNFYVTVMFSLQFEFVRTGDLI